MLYSFVLALCYLLFVFVADTGLIFGYVLSQSAARIINAVTFLLIVAILWGFTKRRIFSYYLALGLYLLSTLSGIVSLFTIVSLSNSSIGSLSGFMYPISIAAIILNMLTFWYLYGARGYFTGRIVHEGVRDKVFRYTIYAFFVMFIAFIMVFLVSFFLSITRTIDTLMQKINSQTLTESLFFCEEKAGTEKDLCYVALVTKYHTDQSIDRLCDRVQSGFYRFTCHRALA
jgi:hypothetical protein